MNTDQYVEYFFKNYNEPTDKKIATAMFKLFTSDVDKKYYPSIFDEIEKQGTYSKFINNMFENTIFTNKEKVLKYLKTKDLSTVENDPALVAANSIFGKYAELRKAQSEFNADFKKGHRLWVAAIRKKGKGTKVFYPDANFTMRLSYGKVGDYKPSDAIHYDFFTTLKGVIEKEDPNNWEFVVPAKLKELYNNKDYGQYGKDGKMPVCFTTNNDITGGNSGSPVINGKGELIGCAFDGNWDAMSGDIAFEPELQKTICVDARYILFIIDKYAGAGHLIKEMTIVK